MTESTTNGEHLALWGGRFKSGPSPELARLSKSTQAHEPTPVRSDVRDY